MSRKILVVDDEESIRESLSKVLHTEGYEIVLAENGQRAIEKLVQGHVDLLLLDIGLPVKDGWDTLRWLTHANWMLPIIVITGRWKQGELAEAAGADVMMEKPLDVPKLLETIQELLQEPLENRVRRICKGKRNFRHVPCDAREFCAQLLERANTPYRFDAPPEKRNH